MRIQVYIAKSVLLAALFLLPYGLFSQEHYLGVRGGYGVSNMSFNPFIGDRVSVSGIDFGVAYKLYAEKYMGTQVELNYIHTGYKLEKTTEATTTTAATATTTTYNGRAIELPLMAQGFLRFGGFRVFLNAGVFGMYMVSQDVETLDLVSGSAQSESYTFSDRDNRFEYGILGGGGLAFQLKKIEFQVDARYQYNLGYAMKPRYKDELTIFANRNRLAFSVALFYNF